MDNKSLWSTPGTETGLDVDLYVINDNLSLDTVAKLRKEKVFDPDRTVIIIDQSVPPNSPEASSVQRQLMQLSGEQNIALCYGQTMTGQYLQKKAKAGQVIAACTPTVTAAGAKGAIGICIKEELVAETFASGRLKINVPKCVKLSMKPAEKKVCLKDAALQLLKSLDGKRLEGALAVLDQETFCRYSTQEVAGFATMLTKAGVFSAVMGAEMETADEITLDVEGLGALVQTNIEDGAICQVSDMEPKQVNVVFIGGSTGGSFEEIEIVAKAVRGKKIAYGVRLSVAPATSEIYKQMAAAGYISDIIDAGGLVLNQCADPEIQCRVGSKEVMVSNDWKNHRGYAGYEDSEIILTNTEIAAEAALSGMIGKRSEKETNEEDVQTVVIEGKCWKFGDDIDTDIIIPTQWVCVPMEEMKRHAFEPLRPELADMLREGDIIVAGDNFGCGSSREMAAEVITANGVRCIVAKSFARIFFRNAINNGILLIECPELPDQVAEGDTVRVELNHQIICGGKTFPIGKIQQNLYEIIADGGLVRNIEKKVKRGEL